MLAPSDVVGFCDELSGQLLEVRDADRGHALVTRVLRTRDLYHGPWLQELPDLLVEWNDAVPVGSARLANGAGASVRATGPGFERVEGSNGFGRSGENRRDGWFVAVGPGIRAGRTGHPVSILDFAPTVCRALEVQEDGFDGNAILEIAT